MFDNKMTHGFLCVAESLGKGLVLVHVVLISKCFFCFNFILQYAHKAIQTLSLSAHGLIAGVSIFTLPTNVHSFPAWTPIKATRTEGDALCNSYSRVL